MSVIQPPSVHHLAVQVSRLKDAERFYVQVLGLPVLRRWRREDGTERSVWLELGGGAFLALEEVEPGPPRAEASTGWHCVALSIEPGAREAWIARLASAGHPVERESDFTLYVRDPEGALVALSHHPTPR